jgi:putative nucleotidyltransferase-like protein
MNAEPAATLSPLELIAAALRGTPAAWPDASGEHFERDVLVTAGEHGVDARLAAGWAEAAAWPTSVCEQLHRSARVAAVVEAVRLKEVQAVLGALHQAGVSPLVVKGTALAYCLYPAPHERPRTDTDLFFRSEDVDRAWEVFRARGYARAAQNTGRFVSHQFACARTDEHGVWHAFDLHWKLANPQVFANLIGYELLVSRAMPVPSLGPHGRVPGRVDQLVIACLHQAAHHPDHLRLIWTLDVHLLASSLGEEELARLPSFARERGLAIVCAHGLRAAQRWMGTAIPAHVMEALDSVDPRSEPSARYLGHVSRLENLLVDLRQLAGWRERLRLIREHAFPPTDYMLRRYKTTRRAWLPALYAHRLLRGGWRWVRHA